MKKFWLSIGLTAWAISGLTQQQTPGPRDTAKEEYSVVERGAHHKVWERIEVELAPDGTPIERRRSYQELATGMHFKNERGEWEESKEEIEILPNNSGAIAAKGQHKVIFPVEIKSGIIEMQASDGQWLRSRVWGLAYFDATSGESVLLAEVKESDGQLVGDNVVVYPDAFTDFRADVRYTYTRAGFEQDVVLRENPPAPQDFGLNPATTRLQVLTEFVEAATPQKTTSQAGGLSDQTLGFGTMNIGIGKAFSVDAQGAAGEDIPVAKQWEQLEGRDYLIEEVLYQNVKEQLRKLPEASKYEGASLQRRGRGEGVLVGLKNLMPRRYAKSEPTQGYRPRRMAKASFDPSSSFVMDYVSVGSSLTNYTFKGDTTYHVTGAVLLYGTNVMEGNTVIKYNASAYLRVMDKMRWETDAYRPAVLTAKDDNSVGETISGSTGNPSGYYATFGIYYASPNSPVDIKYTQFRHANYGIAVTVGGGHTHRVRNCQFWNVNYGTHITSTTAELENLLYHRIGSRAIYGVGSTIRASHLTVHQASNVLHTANSASITNSLFVWITNWPTSFTSVNNATNNDSATFQTVGGGAHYLANNSPYRDIGSTNLSAAMLADLRRTTTYPPIAYTNVTFASPMTFNPQAQRDAGIPDLGYHYDPLDYSFGGCHANSNITFTAGAAVGWFRTSSGWQHAGHGIHLGTNHAGIFQGSVDAPCYWVRLNTVQENDRTAGYGPGGLSGWGDGMAYASLVRMQFTRCSMMAADANHMRDDWGKLDVVANHCEFYGGGVGTYISDYALTNCLFYRAGFGLEGGNTNYNTFNILQNCTFYGGQLWINRWGGGHPGQVKVTVVDTTFDQTSISTVGEHNYDSALSYYNYNAYRTNASRTAPQGANDVIVTNFNWQTSWLGNFYLPTNSPLINTGSVSSAATVGLYHFTTQTNQVKEETTRIDIGYHYVAVLPQGSGAQAMFIGTDTATQGNWKGKYGADGYNVILNAASYPSYVSASVSGKADHTWAGSSSNARALEKAASSDRIAACWYSGTDFTVNLNLTDDRYHRVAFYCLDWDGANGRAQTVEIRDAGSGVLLDTRSLSSFSDGKYLLWDIRGNVNVKFVRTGTANSVISGIFFAPTAQMFIDTDGDGIPDYFEDSNGNGVYASGDLANWTSADTDGDGVNDALELLQGRNPTVSGTVNDSGNLIRFQTYTPLKP